jgi:hypothetical protein
MLLAVAKTRQVLALVAAFLTFAAGFSAARAQGPWHYLHKSDMPPGAIGLRQLARGGPLPGYFQPVEVTAPQGTLLSVVADGDYSAPQRDKLLVGMLIGQVYRLKVSNVPNHEGLEIFPTVEVIDRLYPPPGQAARFPIPIELTEEEIKMAMDGRFVLRVIYLEEPRTAMPVQQVAGRQPYYEITPGTDAMEAADRLGRPMAILRMGSRVPLPEEDQSRFLYQQPPVQLYENLPPPVERNAGLEARLPAAPRLR